MIRFESVSKNYGAVQALRDVSFHVPEGSFCVLIGPSGCGKTTALKMINRLITPTSGRVFVAGEDVSRRDAVELRRNIGYVIQEIGLFPHMTIAENIALVPRLKGWPKGKREQRADELLHLVGLDPAKYRNRFPRDLSGGERQRVGVARALASDPPIVLMDEPFGATDPITRKQLQRELKRIESQVKKTFVFVTHDISEAFLLADSICLMKDGQVVQHASPEEMLRNPANEFVAKFIGDEALLHQFEYLRVGEIAGPAPTVVDADAPVSRVAAAVARDERGLAAVVDEGGRLVGIVTGDGLRRNGADGTTASGRAADIAVPPAVVFQDERVRDCFARFVNPANGRASQNGVAPSGTALVVVDGDRRPRGVIGYPDLVRLVAQLAQAAPGGNGVNGRSPDTGRPPGSGYSDSVPRLVRAEEPVPSRSVPGPGSTDMVASRGTARHARLVGEGGR